MWILFPFDAPVRASNLRKAQMTEKIIRDPVHDVIAFQTDRPIEGLLFRLLNAAEFQRLRRIRQLGMASLAYPGADHSRYSHSLGVMETARKMLEQLGRAFALDEGPRDVCLIAALLHDLGHGPFSHIFERVAGIDHESHTRQIIDDPASDVHQLLAEHDRALPGLVSGMFSPDRADRTFFDDILSSQLDADRLDYLLRDNLMTGSGYGDYDLGWLLHALTIGGPSRRLAVTWKGVSAVEAYLQSRYHMYRNVYFHKVVRSAEGMVKLALQRARRLAVQDRLSWPPREHVVAKALLGQRLATEEFTELDDISMLHSFKIWTGCDDPPLAALCRGLLFRQLFKVIDLSALDEPAARQAVASAQHAIAAAGGDPAYDCFYDEPSETPYESYEPRGAGGAGEILVADSAGEMTTFASRSPLPQALHRQLMFRRLHVASEFKGAAMKAITREI